MPQELFVMSEVSAVSNELSAARCLGTTNQVTQAHTWLTMHVPDRDTAVKVRCNE